MKVARLEPVAWTLVLAFLSVLIAREGLARAALERAVPLSPKELYQTIASSQVKLQILDIRDDIDEFEDTHVPGAIPLPGCDLAKATSAAAEQVLASVPTIIVSATGAREAFEACAARFTQARNLEGGLEGWVDEGLPEDSGEYVPPKPAAGGGCL